MKATILLLIISMAVFLMSAQTPVKDQPGQAYFDMLEKTIIEKTIPETQLLALKPSPIPENFMDTLKKYDWAYLGGYFYIEQKFFDYKNYYKEYRIIRFDNTGGELNFVINGNFHNQLSSLNVIDPPHVKWNVKKINNSWYFEHNLPDTKEYHKILFYEKGTFVYLITKTGKVTDNKIYFREVYTAVPKIFTWNYNE
jgi:hypothetical protein